MDEKIVQLNESDLDNVVGGAFNQKAVAEMGLEVRTGKSGAQAFVGEMDAFSGDLSKGREIHIKGILSERTLRSALNHDNLSVSVKTATGEMKKLSRDDLAKLLS